MSVSLNSDSASTVVLQQNASPATSTVSTEWQASYLQQKPPSAYGAFVFPILAGLLIRIVVGLVWLGGTELNNDAADYFSEATKLASGSREAVAFYWPPGTSYYLLGWFKLFGSSVLVARTAMIVLSTVQIGVIAALTVAATDRRRLGVLAAWVWALYPPSILLVAQTYSQHLAAFALAATAWFGIKWIRTQKAAWLVPLGLSLGVGCLARPSMMSVVLLANLAIGVVAVWSPGSWLWRGAQTGMRCLLISSLAGLVVAPTILHNARTGGGYSLSTNNERNFFLGNNPYTPWYKTSHFAQRTLDELSPEIRDYLKSHYEAPDRRAVMKAAALKHIAENPGLAALRTVNRARSFWGFDYLGTRAIQATANPSRIVAAVLLLAEAGGYFLVMVLGLVGLLHFSRQMQPAAALWFTGVIAAYAGPYCLAFASGTYHFPVMGVVAPFAALGIETFRVFGWRATLSPVRTLSVLMVFVLMQIEYGYFTLAAGITEYPVSKETVKKDAVTQPGSEAA